MFGKVAKTFNVIAQFCNSKYSLKNENNSKFIETVNVIAIVTHWIYNGTLKIAKIGKFSCFSFLKLIEAMTGK